MSHICWICFKPKAHLKCDECPRVFHEKCAFTTNATYANNQDDQPISKIIGGCRECHSISEAINKWESGEEFEKMSSEKLNMLICFSLKALEKNAPKAFLWTEDKFTCSTDFKITWSAILEKTCQNYYRCPREMFHDVFAIHYNIVLSTQHDPRFMSQGQSFLNLVAQDIHILELCPYCVFSYYTQTDKWMTYPCPWGHFLVFAYVRGHGVCAAKLLKINKKSRRAELLFFGGGERGSVDVKLVRHPVASDFKTSKANNKRKQMLIEASEYFNIIREIYPEQVNLFKFRTPLRLDQPIFINKPVSVSQLFSSSLVENDELVSQSSKENVEQVASESSLLSASSSTESMPTVPSLTLKISGNQQNTVMVPKHSLKRKRSDYSTTIEQVIESSLSLLNPEHSGNITTETPPSSPNITMSTFSDQMNNSEISEDNTKNISLDDVAHFFSSMKNNISSIEKEKSGYEDQINLLKKELNEKEMLYQRKLVETKTKILMEAQKRETELNKMWEERYYLELKKKEDSYQKQLETAKTEYKKKFESKYENLETVWSNKLKDQLTETSSDYKKKLANMEKEMNEIWSKKFEIEKKKLETDFLCQKLKTQEQQMKLFGYCSNALRECLKKNDDEWNKQFEHFKTQYQIDQQSLSDSESTMYPESSDLAMPLDQFEVEY